MLLVLTLALHLGIYRTSHNSVGRGSGEEMASVCAEHLNQNPWGRKGTGGFVKSSQSDVNMRERLCSRFNLMVVIKLIASFKNN